MFNIREYVPNLRNAVAMVCGFAIAAGIWWWWTSRPKHLTPAERVAQVGELDRIEYAIRNARSWRVTTTGTMHGEPFETDQDVMCPFNSHTVTRINAPGRSGVAEEFIETKDTFYAREGSDPWASQPRPGTDKCALGPMAGPAPLISTLESVRASTVLSRGTELQFEGGSCRVWDLLTKNGAGASMGSICVDEMTHLPYEFRMGALRVHYSNWNLPAAIDTPVSPTSDFTQP